MFYCTIKHTILDTPMLEVNDPKYIRYKSMEERMKTFKNWPLSYIRSDELVAEGFIYTGNKDLVICVYCGVNIKQWEEGDEPSTEHRKHSPTCSPAATLNKIESSSGMSIYQYFGHMQ